jgi:hypothetical protein
MESRKRKLPRAWLQRRVKARAEPEPDLADRFGTSESAPSEEEVQQYESGSGSSSDSEGSKVSVSQRGFLLHIQDFDYSLA